METVKRGDLWFADLGYQEGCEQGGKRPVVIIQNDIGNMYAPTVIVAAITAKKKKRIFTHMYIDPTGERILEKSTIMFEQIRTIDKNKLMDRIGTLSEEQMQEVDRKIMISLGLVSVGEIRKVALAL